MRFNLISNLDNGVGLQRDYRMLRSELEQRGHAVTGVQFNSCAIVPADVNVFLEVVNPKLFPCAPEQWLIPNPEWHFAAWPMEAFDRVLVKTRDAERIFRAIVGDRCEYLGWMARDLYVPEVRRHRRFLHVSGKSQFKNTLAVLYCWKQYRPDAELILIGEHYSHLNAPNVRSIYRVSDDEMVGWLNGCQFHLMPSAYEGFGHALHESLGVGAVVVTTDAAPMNEVPAAVLMAPCSTSQHHLGTLYAVSPEGVRDAVEKCLAMDENDIFSASHKARIGYLKETAEFRQRLDKVLGC